jgi:hypothetical protein
MSDSRAIDALLDTIIPPSADGRLPGAGAAGLAAYLDDVARNAPELTPVLEEGLAALDARAGDRGAEDFASLDPEARAELLEGLSSEQPAFLPLLSFHVYAGYYQDPQVARALGTRPAPFPDGYEVEPNDLSLLDPVRERAPLYRDV